MASTSIILIFFCHLILQVSAEKYITPRSCPPSFQCAGLGEFEYPFTTVFNPSCGVCVLNCSEPVKTIGLTSNGPWYDIINSFSSNKSFLVQDLSLRHILDRCIAIENWFRLPSSSSVSFTILSNTTLWNCPLTTGNRSNTLRLVTECGDHNVYYNNDSADGFSGCKSVQYPTQLIVELSNQCQQCVGESGSCQDLQNGGFHCSNNGKVPVLNLLVASGTTLLVLMAFVICAQKGATFRGIVTIAWTTTTAKGNQNVEAFLKIYGSLAPTRYTYSDIKLMTNSFKYKLGEGGYGTVYKGMLPDGRLVAVKKWKNLKSNGGEFVNEVVSISRTNYVNVVSLLGFCFQGENRALVYEFMPNGSLEKYICRAGNVQPLAQETMLHIAVGVAKGLDYLHKGCNARILHFDIKRHNILLDQEFRPKISDFGLAKLSETRNSVTSMIEVRGTVGYIAPEIFCRNFGVVSHKSDVYSYGMMVLDMACGRENLLVQAENNSEQYFPDWIYTQLELEEQASANEITDHNERGISRKMILVGLWCIQMSPSSRPSMSKVVEMLEGEMESIEMPPKSRLHSPLMSGTESSDTIILTVS